MDIDNLSSNLLKAVAFEISAPISFIFNIDNLSSNLLKAVAFEIQV